jgi:uncharacterized Zn-finger protein
MYLGHRRLLLRGPVLIGFNEMFADASGREDTPRPYVTVKPALVGGVLLPFECPHCEAVKPEMVHPKRSQDYKDERGFSWCPGCRVRYVLDEKGAPLAEGVEVGATHAPAVIERGGKTAVIGGRSTDGLKLLGA